MNLEPLFQLMVDKGASDLFFASHSPVKIKVDGRIMPVNKLELSPKMVRQAAIELMTEEQLDEFTRELDKEDLGPVTKAMLVERRAVAERSGDWRLARLVPRRRLELLSQP